MTWCTDAREHRCLLKRILPSVRAHMPASSFPGLWRRTHRGKKAKWEKSCFWKVAAFEPHSLNWKIKFPSQTILCKEESKREMKAQNSEGENVQKINKPSEKNLHYKTFHCERLVKADIVWVEKLFFLPQAQARMEIRIQKSAVLFLCMKMLWKHSLWVASGVMRDGKVATRFWCLC